MNVLILGASGFLGSSLSRHYQSKGNNVFKASYRVEQHSESIISIEKIISSGNLDLVINASASQLSKDDPDSLISLVNSNVVMPAILASLIKKHCPRIPLINFGTSWQIDESGKGVPFNAYAASKTAAEPFFGHFAQDGLKIATLRLYDTYGPRDGRNKIINLIADSLINHTLLEMSAGMQAVDFVYIEDVIAAVEMVYRYLIDTPNGTHEIFSIRSGRVVTVLDLLRIVKEAVGLDSTPWIIPGVYPYRERERFVLFDETRTVPGWNARVILEEGVRKVLADRGCALNEQSN